MCAEVRLHWPFDGCDGVGKDGCGGGGKDGCDVAKTAVFSLRCQCIVGGVCCSPLALALL